VPLASTFVLSSKDGKEAYVQPVVQGDDYHFDVKVGRPPSDAKDGTKLVRANFSCVISGTPISGEYIKAEGKAGRMGAKLMAIVAEGDRGRVYLPPTKSQESIAISEKPGWKPDVEFFQQALGFRVGNYGMTKWCDLFTDRQLVALTTLSDLVAEARERIYKEAVASGSAAVDVALESNGAGPRAYAEAVSVYLAFALSKVANIGSSIASWMSDRGAFRETFARQAIPMVWDYAEANPFADAGGSLGTALEKSAMVLDVFPASSSANVRQLDAATQKTTSGKVVSTDPPYYDNIGYADLSDFFYVWLRRSLRPVFPEIFATLAVPKAEELVATPFRHGGRENAETFFLSGMTQAMQRIAEQAHIAFPVTIYYAFKQSESESELGTASTGWETFLEAVIRSGFSLSGTWPMRTEGAGRLRGQTSNALASSIVLVCRRRGANAPSISRRAFMRELNQVLPEALDEMTKGAGGDRSPVAPVDLSQAIIGPGMAVFSKYADVLEADGTPMSVRTALQLINRFLAEDDFDHDTQFCLHWFEQNGWKEGKFGEADTLARAKGTSVDGVKYAGVIQSGGGLVRLLKWPEYPSDWDPKTDDRLPVWEALHQLIRVFKTKGESAAGVVLAAMQSKAEATRQLAYRLYTLCERAGWAEDARAYNEIVTSWSAIESAAAAAPVPQQATLFG
jgi:putative DNA methylase